MKTFSVIIPVYNVEEYLEPCIDSVLGQQYEDYEIILVDDGSTDGSGQICDRYAQQHPQVRVIHQSNKGLGGARNTGIMHADAQYLIFLDSDDYITGNMLADIGQIIARHPCDMVLYDMIAIHADGRWGERYRHPIDANCLLQGDRLKPLAFVSGACARAFRRGLFTDSGILFPEQVWYEDLRTVNKLLPYTQSAYYTDACAYYVYRQRDGSIMHTPNYARITAERIAAVDDVLGYYEDTGYAAQYAEELAYLALYHGYFLPVREMVNMGGDYRQHVDALREHLFVCITAEQCTHNRYIALLSAKERMMLRLFLGRHYGIVRLLNAMYKMVKKVVLCLKR